MNDNRKSKKFVHEGKYAAEVPVELIEEEGGWSPYLSLEDAQKLERFASHCAAAISWKHPNMLACSN